MLPTLCLLLVRLPCLRAWVAASLAPVKDMEVIVMGETRSKIYKSEITCPGFMAAAPLRRLEPHVSCICAGPALHAENTDRGPWLQHLQRWDTQRGPGCSYT